jgi:hypothetical protein
VDVGGTSVGEQRVVKRFGTLSLASIRLQTGWSRASIGRAATQPVREGCRAPARFDEARASLRDEIERSTASWVPDLTLVAVMSTEMIPQIVQEDGPEWAASVLTHLASNILSGHSQGRTRQRGGMLSHGGDATRQYCSSL